MLRPQKRLDGSRRDVVLLANDLPACLGLPTSSPGLRADQLARICSSAGLDTWTIVPAHVAARRLGQGMDVRLPPGVSILPDREVSRAIDAARPKLLILINDRHAPLVGTIQCPIWLDLLAPKHLEIDAADLLSARESVENRIPNAVLEIARRAILITTPGARKVELYDDFFRERGHSIVSLMHLPLWTWGRGHSHDNGDEEGSAVRRILVGGYEQAWHGESLTLELAEVLADRYSDINVIRHSVSAHDRFAGGGVRRCDARLGWAQPSSRVTPLGVANWPSYEKLIRGVDLFIDATVGESIERYYAWVTRCAVAISVGVPCIIGYDSEISGEVMRTGAGAVATDARTVSDFVSVVDGLFDRAASASVDAWRQGAEALKSEWATAESVVGGALADLIRSAP